MKDKKTINTGIRLTPSQYARVAALAKALGVKRNHVFGVLIDSAEVKTRPVVNVQLETNRRTAQVSEANSSATALA